MAVATASLRLLALLFLSLAAVVTHTHGADTEILMAIRLYDGGQQQTCTNGCLSVYNDTDLAELGAFTSGTVLSLAYYRGKVIVGGRFDSVDGITANSLAVWDPQTQLFDAFPGGDGVSIWKQGAQHYDECSVEVLYVWNDVLYIGGWFSNINQVYAQKIASWDGVKASSLGNGLVSDPPHFQDFDSGSTRVYNMIAYGGSLYVTGSFTYSTTWTTYSKSSDLPLNFIGRWDGSQWHQLPGLGVGADLGWAQDNGASVWFGVPSRFTNGTKRITDPESHLTESRTAAVMGGKLVLSVYDLRDANFSATVAHGIVGWDGTDWLTNGLPYFQCETENAFATAVSQLYTSKDGTRVYAVGSFSNIYQGSVYVDRTLQLSERSVAVSADGGHTWSALGQSLGAMPYYFDGVDAITEYKGELYIGGRFKSTGLGVQQFAKWNSTSWVQLPYPYDYPISTTPYRPNQIKTLTTFTVRDYGCSTVLARLLANPDLSIFAALINSTSTSTAYHLLTDPAGTRTVFAPTDAAMEGLQFASDDAISAFVLQHIVEGVAVPYSTPTLVRATLFSALYNTTTLKLGQTQARPLAVSATPSGGPVVVFGVAGIANDTAAVTVDPRTSACSGHYLHTVNKAFASPQNVVAQLTRLGATEFVAALTAANLISSFSTTASITVFAPTNAAFNAMSPGWRNLNSTSLVRLLKTHIVAAVLYKSDVGNQTLATSSSVSIDAASTVRAGSTTVTLRSGLNGTTVRSTVTSHDYFASNGVIHVVDKVILPWRLYAYTKLVTIPTAVNGTALSANISATKDCIVQQTSGTMTGGFNVVYGTTPLCCITRGVIDRTKNPVVMSVGCDLGTTSSSPFFIAPNRTSSYAYTNCYSTPAESTQPSTPVIDAAAHVAQGSLDASSSYGNNATSTQRSATIVTSTVTEGAYPFSIAGTGRRRATSTLYCTGKGTLAVGTPSTCVMNVCSQSTTNFIVVDLASATDGSVCYHTCYQ